MKRTIITQAGVPKVSFVLQETASGAKRQPRTISTQALWTRYIDSRLKQFSAASR